MSASAVRIQAVTAEPRKARADALRSIQPSVAAQLTAVGADIVRQPAATPINRAWSMVTGLLPRAARCGRVPSAGAVCGALQEQRPLAGVAGHPRGPLELAPRLGA